MSTWHSRHTIEQFNAQFREGVLTGADVVANWHRERDDYRVEAPWMSYDQEAIPFEIREDLDSGHAGFTAKRLREWSPVHVANLPAAVAWLRRTMSWDWFQKQTSVDHANFVRDLLTDPYFGARVRLEAGNNPTDLLRFLPEEERWQVLENIVLEFGHALHWGWPGFTAEWDLVRTQHLVHKLIEHPDRAGAFLANGYAHFGWSAFRTGQDLLDILRKAAMLAPFEANLNRRWLETVIGDRLHNPVSFMLQEEYGGWENYAEQLKNEFAPYGAELTSQLLTEATHTYERGLRSEDAPLSKCSRRLVARVMELNQLETIHSTDALKFAQILLDLPDSNLGRTLVARLVKGCQLETLGTMYRYLISIDRRFSRTRYLILDGLSKEQDTSMRSIGDGEAQVRASWFDGVVRTEMEKLGWDFRTIQHRRNDKYPQDHRNGYNLQISFRGNGWLEVFNLYRGNTIYGDHFRTQPPQKGERCQEVMVPPTFSPGKPSLERGMLRIYNVGELFQLAEPIPQHRRDD